MGDLNPYFFLALLALRCSERAIAIACLGLVTLGPFLEPLCNLPFLNSSMTIFTLALDLGVFLALALCGAIHFEHFFFMIILINRRYVGCSAW